MAAVTDYLSARDSERIILDMSLKFKAVLSVLVLVANIEASLCVDEEEVDRSLRTAGMLS